MGVGETSKRSPPCLGARICTTREVGGKKETRRGKEEIRHVTETFPKTIRLSRSLFRCHRGDIITVDIKGKGVMGKLVGRWR